MKHGPKKPNPVRTNVPPPAPMLFVAKRIFSIPNPALPGAFMNVLERKGRTFADPINRRRLRGKRMLRIAKAARVHQRIELFEREARRRGDTQALLVADDYMCRDIVMHQWRTADVGGRNAV